MFEPVTSESKVLGGTFFFLCTKRGGDITVKELLPVPEYIRQIDVRTSDWVHSRGTYIHICLPASLLPTYPLTYTHYPPTYLLPYYPPTHLPTDLSTYPLTYLLPTSPLPTFPHPIHNRITHVVSPVIHRLHCQLLIRKPL